VTTAEVGNIFKFGTEKSEQMGIYYTAADGSQKPIYLASYGIGITRVMGVIVEKFADDKGIVWPVQIAPYQVYLVSIGEKGSQKADELYKELTDHGIEVLYDDRDARPGEKFADAELIGLPYRVTVSERGVEAGTYEFTERQSGETSILTHEELLAKLGELLG
jgi:prolyl-tRNA synthetase